MQGQMLLLHTRSTSTAETLGIASHHASSRASTRLAESLSLLLSWLLIQLPTGAQLSGARAPDAPLLGPEFSPGHWCIPCLALAALASPLSLHYPCSSHLLLLASGTPDAASLPTRIVFDGQVGRERSVGWSWQRLRSWCTFAARVDTLSFTMGKASGEASVWVCSG